MTQTQPLPNPADPQVEHVLRFRMTEIRTAIDNKDAHGILLAIYNIGRDLHPDLAAKVLTDLITLGTNTLAERHSIQM